MRAPFAVPYINENDAAEVAPRVDPTGQSDSLPGMGHAQFIAMMRPFFHGLANKAKR